MKRPTDAQAARIERRIELLRADGHHDQADALERDYWDACNLSPDTRAQLESRRAGTLATWHAQRDELATIYTKDIDPSN